jgi:hypothetical protein
MVEEISEEIDEKMEEGLALLEQDPGSLFVGKA